MSAQGAGGKAPRGRRHRAGPGSSAPYGRRPPPKPRSADEEEEELPGAPPAPPVPPTGLLTSAFRFGASLITKVRGRTPSSRPAGRLTGAQCSTDDAETIRMSCRFQCWAATSQARQVPCRRQVKLRRRPPPPPATKQLSMHRKTLPPLTASMHRLDTRRRSSSSRSRRGQHGPPDVASHSSRLPCPRMAMPRRQSRSARASARAAPTVPPHPMMMCCPCCGMARWRRNRHAASPARAPAAC